MIINVIVAEKNAIAMPHEALVCGNSDYVIEFQFDAEWDQHPTKTARFIFDNRSYTDVMFTGTQCPVPVLSNTHEVIVGVFAGDLKTTTPAYLRAQRSILCYGGEKTEFSQDEYDLIMGRMNEVENIAIGAEDALKGMNGSSGLYIVSMSSGNKCDRSQAEILEAVATNKICLLVDPIGNVHTYAGKQADGSPKFARFNYVRDGDNKGIRSAIVVINKEGVGSYQFDTPAKTPNPHALKIIGAVNVTYDGSEGVTVEIPTGVKLTVDADGNATI